jgi:hypothetical protein
MWERADHLMHGLTNFKHLKSRQSNFPFYRYLGNISKPDIKFKHDSVLNNFLQYGNQQTFWGVVWFVQLVLQNAMDLCQSTILG